MEMLGQFFNAQTPVLSEACEVIKSKFTELNFDENEYIISEGQRIPQKHLASYIGISSETYNRHFAEVILYHL